MCKGRVNTCSQMPTTCNILKSYIKLKLTRTAAEQQWRGYQDWLLEKKWCCPLQAQKTPTDLGTVSTVSTDLRGFSTTCWFHTSSSFWIYTKPKQKAELRLIHRTLSLCVNIIYTWINHLCKVSSRLFSPFQVFIYRSFSGREDFWWLGKLSCATFPPAIYLFPLEKTEK